MKKKNVSIFVCMLLITTVFSLAAKTDIEPASNFVPDAILASYSAQITVDDLFFF